MSPAIPGNGVVGESDTPHMWHEAVQVSCVCFSKVPNPAVVLHADVEVRYSGRNKGYGLYCSQREIPPETEITYYEGVCFYCAAAGIRRFSHGCTYTKELSEGWYLDACARRLRGSHEPRQNPARGWAHVVNTCVIGKGGRFPATIRANCKFVCKGKGRDMVVVLTTKRLIKPGDELLLNYHDQIQHCGYTTCTQCCN
jgi:hypothetical protein